MKLKEFARVIQIADEMAGDADPEVTIFVGGKEYDIGHIYRQFGLIPDVTISVGVKLYDDGERNG